MPDKTFFVDLGVDLELKRCIAQGHGLRYSEKRARLMAQRLRARLRTNSPFVPPIQQNPQPTHA